MKNIPSNLDTKDIVMNAAIIEFAKNGYFKTKISDICKRAKANVSAVNYYFQSKDNLYLEVWKVLWNEFADRINAVLNGGFSPEQCLEQLIRINIRDVISDTREGMLTKITYYEMGTPSPLYNELDGLYFQPHRKLISKLLTSVFKNNLDDFTMQIAAGCIREPIYGLISTLVHDENAKKDTNINTFAAKMDIASLRENGEIIVDTITRFVMGGLKSLASEK